MSFNGQFSRALGVLSIIVALQNIGPAIDGTRAFLPKGHYVKGFLSLAGVLSIFLLLAAGIVLCAKRDIGRRMAYCACLALASVCTILALIGVLGGHGALATVGSSVSILLLLRATAPDRPMASL